MIDKVKLREALETVNDAIFELNNNNRNDENFYWWNAVLETFDLYVDEVGALIVDPQKVKLGEKTFFDS